MNDKERAAKAAQRINDLHQSLMDRGGMCNGISDSRDTRIEIWLFRRAGVVILVSINEFNGEWEMYRPVYDGNDIPDTYKMLDAYLTERTPEYFKTHTGAKTNA